MSAMRNVLLLFLLACLVGLHWLIRPDPSRRNYEFLPDMVASAAHDAQAPIPVLPGDVRIDLRPPAGTVARGYLPLGYAATLEGALLAGEELSNPFPADDTEALSRGAIVYNTFCSVCHGLGGLGDGPVTKRGVPPPPSLLADKARGMTDGQIYHVISLGQGNMAPYTAQVQREDRWKAILYVRSLQDSTEQP